MVLRRSRSRTDGWRPASPGFAMGGDRPTSQADGVSGRSTRRQAHWSAARIHSPPKMPAGTGAVAFRSVLHSSCSKLTTSRIRPFHAQRSCALFEGESAISTPDRHREIETSARKPRNIVIRSDGTLCCSKTHRYSITPSARTRNDSGIVSPIALTVLSPPCSVC